MDEQVLVESLDMLMDGMETIKLDPKGRIIVPTRYREAIGDAVAIRRGDGCLYLYPQAEWLKEKRRLFEEAKQNVRMERKNRAILATTSSDLEIDKQGRLLLPLPQRQFAGLERDVVLSAFGNRLEIWDAQRFDAFMSEVQDASDADIQSEWEGGK